MKVTIEITVPESPARDDLLEEAMAEAGRRVSEALYRYSLEGGQWDHWHVPLRNIFDQSLIGHVDLSVADEQVPTKEPT